MACAPCSQARAATISAIRHVATGDLAAAKQDMRVAAAALADKATVVRANLSAARARLIRR